MKITTLSDGRHFQEFLFFLCRSIVHVHLCQWDAAASTHRRAVWSLCNALFEVEC